jgi:hypothetical protein
MAALGQGGDVSGSVLLTWHEKVRRRVRRLRACSTLDWCLTCAVDRVRRRGVHCASDDRSANAVDGLRCIVVPLKWPIRPAGPLCGPDRSEAYRSSSPSSSRQTGGRLRASGWCGCKRKIRMHRLYLFHCPTRPSSHLPADPTSCHTASSCPDRTARTCT